jgi:hypothetical protein
LLRYEIETFGGLPISLSTAKSFLKIIVSTDDAIIQKIIEGVAIFAERHTNRELRNNSWFAYSNSFEHCFEIRRAPIASINSLEYVKDGVSNIVDSSTYELDNSGMYPILKLSNGKSWPTDVDEVSDAVRIKFSTRADRRVQEIELSMLRHISDLYENRGDDSLMQKIEVDKRAIRFYDSVRLPSL